MLKLANSSFRQEDKSASSGTIKFMKFFGPLRQKPTLLLCLAFGLLGGSKLLGQTARVPPVNILETGDLIWPKKPGAIVPYNSEPGEADKSAATTWAREKKQYLSNLEKKANPTPEDIARYKELQKMTYKGFVARYLDDKLPGEVTTYGLGELATGHVGLIEVVDGKPDVIEAMDKIGVRRISYASWIGDRPGELVWAGRLKGVSPEKRTAVARIGANYVDHVPYNFWNFDLNDTTGFYCSKLAWFSILNGAGFAPDDNPNPKRVLWYSPKQLMNSKHVQLIFNPGSYSRE
jgi:hypothetical protein